MIPILALLFVLSGAAGLIYESIWSRYLGLFVGHSAYAQVLVLVIFLGGMAGGAAWVSRRSERLQGPLIWYAIVEGVVGILGLVFHDVYVATTGFAYDVLFPALPAGAVVGAAKWTIAAALILPQSLLLGATFPLMTAGVLRLLSTAARAHADSGRVLGLFYFSNSIGAAVGVLLAGFWFIASVGLQGTLLIAGTLNVAVALATYGLVRSLDVEHELPSPDAAAAPPDAGSSESWTDRAPAAEGDGGASSARMRLLRILLAVSVGTAVASFIYEIAWVRMLSLVLGSATHAFELMLSAFILGLALGALAIRGPADRSADPVRLLGLVQFAMGTAAILTLALYLDAFDWMAGLLGAVQRNDAGYALFNVGRYGMALAVMLPATFCAGMTLPLITRTLLVAGVGERAIGAVYAWNTVGSIVGVTLAALWLLPLIGLRHTLILGGVLDIALGLWLLWLRARESLRLRRTASLASVAAGILVLGALTAPGFDPGVLTSGVFRYGSVPDAGSRNILFYQDGRTATVSVQLGADSGFTIATNGKPDASLIRTWFDEPALADDRPALYGDNATQTLLAMVTLAHAPDAREAAVIGLGSGMTSHFLLGSPALERLATIEIEPAMVEASRLLTPANLRVFDDPRSLLVLDDARAFLASSKREFDLIVSEPSNPWVSGVSSLFTDEFYARVARQLTPQGVFGQWLHLYEIQDELVLGILAALDRNFGAYELFLTNDVDVLVVATPADTLHVPDWSVFALEDVATDLRRFRRLRPSDLEATRLLGSAALRPLLREHPGVNSDFYPQLDLWAERARFLMGEASAFVSLPQERFDLGAALAERVVPWTAGPREALQLSRLEAQSLSARLRAGLNTPADTGDAGIQLRAARHRARNLSLSLASDEPPPDWQLWFSELLLAERDRHQGTMGVADTAWYGRVERYLAAQDAPVGAQAAWRFLRAAVQYDWRGAARESAAVILERDRGVSWLPASLLLDAAVLARLRGGDITGARAAFARLANASGRGANDVRTQLLEAQLNAAERATSARPAASTR